MRIVKEETLISVGGYATSAQWAATRASLHTAIKKVDWPPGSGQFLIYPESGKKSGQGNGVVPIKADLMVELERQGWKLEEVVWGKETEKKKGEVQEKKPGKLDAVLETPHGKVALEWETGNISSSHRALNKMAVALMKGYLVAGILVVPSGALAKYLTDRIGNYPELIPYLDLWRAIPCTEGILEIVVIEHDGTSTDVPRISKGTDGRALR